MVQHTYLNGLQYQGLVAGYKSMNLGGSRTTQNIFLQFFALSFCSLERAREKGGRKGRREGVRRE
jgi:hypothetical protein